MMRPTSVRARTTLIASVVVALTLLGGGIALLVTLQHAVISNGDDSARVRVRDLAGLVQTDDLPSTLTAARQTDFAQVVDANGEVIAATADRVGQPPLTNFVPTGSAPQVHEISAPGEDGEPEGYRVWAATAGSPPDTLTIYVGYSMEAVGQTTLALRGALAIGLPVLLAMLAFTTWVLVGRALRPVEAIRAEVAEISAGALDRRVPVPATRDEVERLATTMNAMLDRLAAAARQQRRFVADASHEMQSPLASFRAQLEVATAHADSTDWAETSAALLEDSQLMERLVRDLLFLARSDEQRGPPPRDEVDLDDVVLEEVQRLRATAGVTFGIDQVSAAPVRGSREELTRMVRNLLENAARHALGSVVVELGETDGRVRLGICDDGPGVPTADRERVFDRFVRLDAGRSRRTGGTGLGLAIVRDVARRHGATVEVTDRAAGRGACFVVWLPTPS